MAAPSPRDDSLASTQHATDRFPRFTYLLRTGTPKPEADGGLVRRSADPGEHQASLATIPDPLAQRGTGDETCLQSCVASGSGSTCGPSSRVSSSPSRASTPTTPAGTLASVSKSTTASAPKPLLDPAPYTMANNNSATASRGGASTPRLPVPTRRGTDAIAGERIMPGTPLSTSPTSQTSSDFGDGGADVDDLEQDDAQGGGQTAEGQPRKKKTRRAGVAITRVRRMQREVRRLAEEEEQVGPNIQQQRQQPHQRSLLSSVQARPSLHPSASAPLPLSLHIPQYGHGQQQQYQQHTRVPASPSSLSATRPTAVAEGRHARCEPSTAAHSRASAYDRTLEDGDDVVVWRPSGPMGSSSIWAYRPDERPRGGSA
ncbi:hypothetical protein TRAPUB_313 [Trametes pubescens]|uniref:Uncharacterized protein n=1 Tax=Trametes pubescens TaxID=154538 RepID=A0A1M2VMI9_TRAPU|nr:hypothetical protein TRAPUB_313 [Trametes pubescens]